MHNYYKNTMLREIGRATPGEWDTDDWSPKTNIAFLGTFALIVAMGVWVLL